MRPTIDHLAAVLNMVVILGLVLLLMVVASIAFGVGPTGSWIAHVTGLWGATIRSLLF
jgi:hypothetical protein